MRHKLEAFNVLLGAVRLFSSSGDGAKLDALTFNVDMFTNVQFFSEMVKKAQYNSFLVKQFILNEDPQRLT